MTLTAEQKNALLERVNAALAGLQSTAKYKRLLDAVPGCEALRGKTILMVDDVQDVLESFVSPLMIATHGNASFIRYQGQPSEELVQEILNVRPEIVLIDYHLSETMKGDAIARLLTKQQPEIACIGFSSDKDAKQAFLDAGVKGVAPKEAYDPEPSLQAIANIIGRS